MAGLRILRNFPANPWLRWLGMGIILAVMLSACQIRGLSAELPVQESVLFTPTQENPVKSASLATATPEATLAIQAPATEAIFTSETTPTATPVKSDQLSASEWKTWPVIPRVPESAREIYQRGLALGNDPHAFSILGDCQSLPETFLGIYDTDAGLVADLPEDLQAAVANFAGSFDRQSPTIKGGTTAGAVLWAEWHEKKFTCQESETPLDCELRLHNPSIVIINLGTHYETRNSLYLHKIIDRLIAQGVLPVLSTKADNRELDDRLNTEMAQLAVEYNLPLWNFWAATSDLPNHGVGVKKAEEFLGEIYLSKESLERHRMTALQALAAVWEAVK